MTHFLIRRLRWDADEAEGPGESPAVLARSFAYLYGAGASLILLTLALPGDPGRRPWGIVAVAAAAFAVALLLLWRYERLPGWFLVALPPAGNLFICAALLAGGSGAVAAYATVFFWVVLSAHYFFSPWVGAANTAFVAVTYAGVLELMPAVSQPELRWLTTVVTLGVAGVLVSLLRGRVKRLFTRLQGHARRSDALARFSRLALDPDSAGSLPAEAVALLRREHGADCASVMLLTSDERTLAVAAGAGFSRDIVGEVHEPVRADTLARLALLSTEPVFAADHPTLVRGRVVADEGIRDTVLLPLRGRDDIYGLLAVHCRRPHAFGRAEAAQFEAIAGVLSSALDRARSAERLRHQAFHDDLTGQPNRHLFLERLEGALSRGRDHGTTTAVLFLDLDNFKVLNDSLGHQAGDALLVALVPRLRKALYLSDTIARFGGDEFVILCEGIDGEAGALEVAERLHDALKAPFALRGAAHRLTASIGVALAQGGDGEPETLLRDADAALSRAKAAGRDRTSVYDRGMRSHALNRLRLENALRDALDLGQLHLAYQPIVDLEDGRVVSCEALLRWTHPELGEVPPSAMIPLAEETGMIVPIGEWVIAEACATAARWRRRAGAGAPAVSVNVSPRQLDDAALTVHVASVLRATGLDPSDLVVEITESALLDEISGSGERLDQLRLLGVGLALDDFGTGYSSLSYLRRLPVGTIKIDRSFVATMEEDAGNETIVGAVLGMAVGLGARSVAEGIETPAQLARLQAMGCQLGQGYLFSRPVAAAEVESLLVTGAGLPFAVRASARVA